MGKITGFREFKRQIQVYRQTEERILDYGEIFTGLNDETQLSTQGARCMDCGVPFCQSADGCPVNNLIPEFNDLIYHDRWFEAYKRLDKTNNFPEFTGRVCPAPCEGSCVLGLNDDSVTIKNIECAIIDKAFENDWVKPTIIKNRTNKKIAIIGSGPAGLACADELNKKGHSVTVFERSDRIGGLLMYGIPNMKLGKDIVNRRVDLLKQSGIEFITNTNIGVDTTIAQLQKDFDAVLLATGATKPRDLPVKNREVSGVHFAMEYLHANTKSLLDNNHAIEGHLNAKGKNVIVIGGGDTGTDCIATALRQGAKSIVNFELNAKPTQNRPDNNPWPQWPLIYRVDYGHDEAQKVYGEDVRNYQLMTKQFIAQNDKLIALETVEVSFEDGKLVEKEGSQKRWNADLVFLSMGFLSPETETLNGSDIQCDARGNYQAEYDNYETNQEGVFTAGDCRRGQSLIVWAINEGRGAAQKIDHFLQK
jgi:glutamate synthase (NADPH/NADH) small chain